MKDYIYYRLLCDGLARMEDRTGIDVTVDELAGLLQCTHRNVLHIIRRLEHKGWIDWSPARGRGKRSRIRLLAERDDVVLQAARELIEANDLAGAAAHVAEAGLSDSARQRFGQWMNLRMGHRSEIRDRKKIDTLRVPLSRPFHTLDPLKINLSTESHLVHQLFDSLVRLRPSDGEPEPQIAHAWECDESRTKWRFHLRKGVWFHHGRELSADDVVFSMNRLRFSREPFLYRWAFAAIRDVRAADPNTVDIALEEPNELFLYALGTNRASIVPEDLLLERGDAFGTAPSGTGPFRLASHDGMITVLEAFPYYFGGRAHLDRVEIWNVPEWGGGEPAEGGFQLLHGARLPEEAPERWQRAEETAVSCKFLTFNMSKAGPLQSLPRREAFGRAVSARALAAHWGDPSLTAIGSLLADTALSADPGPHALPDGAPEEAGGAEIELCTIPQYEEDARHIRELAEQAGWTVRIRLLAPDQFMGDLRLAADAFLFAIRLDALRELRLIDLYRSMRDHLPPDLAMRAEHASKRAIREPDKAARTAILRELEETLLHRRALHPLYRKPLSTAFHPALKGVTTDALGWAEFKKIWFATH